ncbi:NADH-quinone oxidoreductase subunit M [Acaryochloris sp. IP29b_bin.137]|uniref:NADH-quinone oxidoreductase subunit M n=1 Tax=Acaryochloris sp. IP29b_bin.137 TaxID=2969217 RepID=UPI00260A78AC|nr:NADH-quinone oxidoreductase subunit M [Acaryochloris sp. IP29b_bin.137]
MLSVLVWFPLFGVLLLALLPKSIDANKYARSVALVVAGLVFAWTVYIAVLFNPKQVTMQFGEFVPWIKAIGLNYHLAVDGLSLPLLGLNSLLTFIAIWSTDPEVERPRFYYALMLLLNSSVAGAFLAQDVLLFFLFYELEIIPLYFLIAIWGGARRSYAATKFLLYTAFSGIVLLATFLGIVWLSGASSFAYEPLRAIIVGASDTPSGLTLKLQLILMVGILLGFGIKIPFFPLHTWLPDAHVEASTPVSVLLAGVLLKLGTYGLLRYGVGLLPDAWVYLGPWLAVWAAVSALYGTSCAISQQDMKKVVAYASIAHMAFILLAAAASTELSMIAAVCQMVSHGLISALLFLLVGVVYKKTGSRDMFFLRGLLNPERGLPLVGSMMILGVMASAGIPGMVGFISEFLTFRGSYPIFPVQTLFCMLATGLTAVYFLLMINRVFFGRLPDELEPIPPVKWSDRLPAAILVVLIFLLGIQPNYIVRWSETQIAALIPYNPRPPQIMITNIPDQSMATVSSPIVAASPQIEITN